MKPALISRNMSKEFCGSLARTSSGLQYVKGQSMGLPAPGQSIMGVADGVSWEAGCDRIHSREPSMICAPSWPPSPILTVTLMIAVYIRKEEDGRSGPAYGC